MTLKLLSLVAVALLVTACERSASYFAENPKAAERVLEDCKSGTHRGPECQNALAAEAKARSDATQAVWRSMQQSNAEPAQSKTR